MKRSFALIFAIAVVVCNGCSNGQTRNGKTSLAAGEFADKMKTHPNAPVIDVRTPGEFSTGHIANAQNYDWNGSEFAQQISALDKSAPVFVYCLSGGRSSAAAGKMRADGFKEVYELEGGMMKWRAAGLPEATDSTTVSAGMTKQQFEELLNSDKLVLIDFYADWCAPCKKMKPYLDEISKDMANKVIVIRINTEDNKALCRELHIDALPVLQLYKNKTLAWSNTGFIEKAEVVKQLQ